MDDMGEDVMEAVHRAALASGVGTAGGAGRRGVVAQQPEGVGT